MTVRRLLALCLLATCLWPARGAAQSAEATLPSKCFDQVVMPSSVVLACGDGGFIAEDLVWTDWGTARATASGTASVKTCDPNCAQGGREQYPVTLTADRLQDCDHGRPQYTRVTYAFPERSPFPPGSPGADDPTYRFACPKRPHANPRITAMRMRLTSNRRGGRYSVRVNVRLRVCAVRGRSEALIKESVRLKGDRLAEHTRFKRFRQTARCQRHLLKWKLRREFFGVGRYKVAVRVLDKDSQISRTVSRSHLTRD